MRDHHFYRQQRQQQHYYNRQRWRHYHSKHREQNRIFFGIIIALIGLALILRTTGIIPNFDIAFTWPVILMVIGLLIGIKSGFRNHAWWILLLIGAANEIRPFQIFGHPSSAFVWPASMIIAGLMIAFRPRRRYFVTPGASPGINMTDSAINPDNFITIDVTFGGKKEIITSKDFKGGTVSTSFGGCELNLLQADFTDTSVTLDIKVAFGGVEVIIPSNWEIQNEITATFGSVEDERTIQAPPAGETKKLLILKGNVSFGSVEIKSF